MFRHELVFEMNGWGMTTLLHEEVGDYHARYEAQVREGHHARERASNMRYLV